MKTLVLRKNLSVFLALVLLMSFSVYTAPRAEAAVNNFVVDTVNWTADANAGDDLCADSEGDCSLRAALEEANADGVTTAITFDAALNGLTITYDANVPAISAPVEITGPGAANLTLDCGTAPAPNAINFTDGGNGSSVTGGFTIENCIGAGQGIIGVRSDTTISDIEMDGAGVIEVHVDGNVDNINISDNILTGGAYIQLAYNGYQVTDGMISGNSITDASGSGIQGIITSGTTVTGNTIASNDSGSAIDLDLEGNDNIITDNIITSSNTHGIRMEATAPVAGLTVTGNSVTTTANNGHGINFDGSGETVTGIDISTNTVTTTNGTGRGIYAGGFADDSTFTITNNIVTSAGNTGIQFDGGGTANDVVATISGNTARAGSYYGFIVNGLLTPTLTMDDNIAGSVGQGNANVGILFTTINGGTLTMDGNSARYNTESGVAFVKSAVETGFDTVTMTNNTMSNNTQSGFYVQMGAVEGYTIGTSGNPNTMSNNTQYGVLISGSGVANVSISYNTISSNTLSGIHMEDHSTGNSISNNTISNNTQNGVVLEDNNGAVAMSGNTISDNGTAASPSRFLADMLDFSFGETDYGTISYHENGEEPLDILADDTALVVADGTNNFNLALMTLTEGDLAGMSVPLMVDENLADTEEAYDPICDALGYGNCNIDVWVNDVYTAAEDSDYVFGAAALDAAGVTVTSGDGETALTYDAGGYLYYGVNVISEDGVNTFTDETLSGNGNGYHFGASTVSQSVSDSSISSLGMDVVLDTANTISMDNTTFTEYDVSGAALLDVNYDAKVRVTDANATAISNATVTATDTNDVTTAMGTTDGTGYTGYTSLDVYQIDNTGIINTKNDYSFLASASGFYSGTTTDTIELQNHILDISLIAESGSSGGSAKSKTSESENSATTFEDITSHWAKEFIEKLFEKGIIDGYEDGTFGPDDGLTRAQLAKIAVRLFEIEIEENLTEAPFVDVAANAWYAPFVKAAVDNDFASGYEDNTFHPDDLISRADALRMLFDAAKIDVSTVTEMSGFPDVANDAWYAKYVAYAAKNGIVSGYKDGTFGPDNNLTRGEISKIAILLLEHLGL